MKFNFGTKESGFTLVETLVAISVLMLAVTGPLYFSSEALKAAVYARDQITAFYLAQDAFEQIRAVRDNNLLVSASWLSGIDAACTTAAGCRIDPFTTSLNLTPRDCTLDAGAQCVNIRIDSTTGAYGYDSTWDSSGFKRTIQVVKESDINEVRVIVTIAWKSGTISRTFSAVEFMRNK